MAFGLATSYPSIVLLGALAAVTFAIAHFPFIDRLVPAVVPYARAAGTACLIASAATMFAFGYRVADGRDQIEQLKSDLARAEYFEDVSRKTAEEADKLKQEADKRASDAEGKLSDYESKFGKNPADPPAGVLEWMRSLQQHPQRRADASANPQQRGVVARLRALGAKRQ
uniref:Uncharacterized protein n=1 Tax=Bradyrhizobium quebecense TaxID=2748629 RepID=A0A973WRS3_9BRAD